MLRVSLQAAGVAKMVDAKGPRACYERAPISARAAAVHDDIREGCITERHARTNYPHAFTEAHPVAAE